MKEAVSTALANNYQVKNASLHIDQETRNGLTSLVLPPTEVNYRFGQLYSAQHDNYFEISQHFGSVLTHIREVKQASIRQSVASDVYEVIKAELTAQVKSAYFLWVFSYALSASYEEEKNMYTKLSLIAELRYKSGDISLLDKTIYEAKVSEAENRFLNSLDDISIAENKLHLLLQDSGAFIPESSIPELYQIEKDNDTSTYTGNRYLNYYKDQYVLAHMSQSIAGSRYFPEINTGFFTQDITGLNQLYGGQIGFAFPLWFPGNKGEIKAARIETELALNELEYQKKKISFEVENLLLELNKNFRQIRYFEATALPQADILISSALNQLETEEIDYSGYLESISIASEIRRKYYKAILDYNETAIQIELYAN